LHIVSNCLQCHRFHHHHETVKIRKQVIDLFDKIKPNNQITIGYKKLTALPGNGGAKIFEGASDKQVMAYFKQLTGSFKFNLLSIFKS
jgi:hypothetical protein